MNLPSWVEEWIKQAGIDVTKFKEFVGARLDKLDLPEVKEEFERWVDEQVGGNLNPDSVIAFVMGVIAEIKSGKSGYWKDAGGSL